MWVNKQEYKEVKNHAQNMRGTLGVQLSWDIIQSENKYLRQHEALLQNYYLTQILM